MNIEIVDLKLSLTDASEFKRWLEDRRGWPLWAWIAQKANNAHDRAAKAPGENTIKDILLSQRDLAMEQAFNDVASYPQAVKDALAVEPDFIDYEKAVDVGQKIQ